MSYSRHDHPFIEVYEPTDMQSENCRLAMNALSAIERTVPNFAQISPLIEQAKRAVNLADGEVQDLQTIAAQYRTIETKPTLPDAYGALGLTGREEMFLQGLLAGNGRMVSSEQLHYWVYGYADDAPALKIVDVFICKIRRKLKDRPAVIRAIETSGHPAIIQTIWGRGYKLVHMAEDDIPPLTCAGDGI